MYSSYLGLLSQKLCWTPTAFFLSHLRPFASLSGQTPQLRLAALTPSLRTADAFPVVASLPPIFRSDDRKCVCGSQATLTPGIDKPWWFGRQKMLENTPHPLRVLWKMPDHYNRRVTKNCKIFFILDLQARRHFWATKLKANIYKASFIERKPKPTSRFLSESRQRGGA